METQNVPILPTSIIFIALFWTLVGAFVLGMTSGYFTVPDRSYHSLFGLIPFILGIGLIIVGWGLLVLRKWAYFSTLILSCISAVVLVIFNATSLSYQLESLWYYASIETLLLSFIPLLFLLMFFCMIGYLIKYKMYYDKTQ
ncbi:MAG: hypothetical protein JW840_09585 [Candidatus Thermoplasmatota archaeon]|nr:hypothetical protein [Candidatus Thermoplasmatota archaeon]